MLNIYQIGNMTNKCCYENTVMVIKLENDFSKDVVIWYDIIETGDLFYK